MPFIILVICIAEYHSAVSRISELRDEWKQRTGNHPPALQFDQPHQSQNLRSPEQAQNVMLQSIPRPQKTPATKLQMLSSAQDVKLHVVKPTISQQTLATSKAPPGQPSRRPRPSSKKHMDRHMNMSTDEEAERRRDTEEDASGQSDVDDVALETECDKVMHWDKSRFLCLCSKGSQRYYVLGLSVHPSVHPDLINLI